MRHGWEVGFSVGNDAVILFIDLGSIIGALDTLESQSILREKYLDNGIVPDWFTGEQAA